MFVVQAAGVTQSVLEVDDSSSLPFLQMFDEVAFRVSTATLAKFREALPQVATWRLCGSSTWQTMQKAF